MTRSIAFYVHHHGNGHMTRTRAIVAAMSLPATVLTSAPVREGTFGAATVIRLPRDDGPAASPHLRAVPPAHLHYAPLGVPGLRDRTARITRFLSEDVPALLVVDVSAEVAQLARLAGVAPVVVRQHGCRWDAPHRAAYAGAVGLLAPFGEELEEPDVPDEIRQRTFYAGGLSRSPARNEMVMDRQAVRHELGWAPHERGVVVLLGSGGAGPEPSDVRAAAQMTSGHRWVVVGPWVEAEVGIPTTGWVDDPLPYLAAADVVVGSAGHNTVMEVALTRRPFICIPEDRPFDEQHRKAARLRALDLAEVVDHWPSPSEWPDILDRASRRGGDRLGRVASPGAAPRAAAWLADLAGRFAA